MRKFIFVLLTLLLVSPFSFAMKGIIWQPQNRDSQVTDTQWQGLMSQLRLQGFDTLVLQWTRYGDAFTQPEQRTLLFKRAAAAQQAGLKLICLGPLFQVDCPLQQIGSQRFSFRRCSKRRIVQLRSGDR